MYPLKYPPIYPAKYPPIYLVKYSPIYPLIYPPIYPLKYLLSCYPALLFALARTFKVHYLKVKPATCHPCFSIKYIKYS